MERMNRMGTPRHGRRKTERRPGFMILAMVLLLVMALGCGALAWGLATDRIALEARPVSGRILPTNALSSSVTEPSKQAAGTTTAPAGGITHYKQGKAPDENLLLVNSWNPLPSGYEASADLVDYDGNGNLIDRRAKDALLQMMNDGADYGLWGILLYRSSETQQEYFDAEVAEWKEKGYSASEAETMAATQVVRPGTSEHHTGLAVDILGSGYTSRTEDFDGSEAFAWVKAHCAEYGFILRYPKGKEAVTGMDYEPWHYRYVGKDAAREIMSRGITLEEYLEEKGW